MKIRIKGNSIRYRLTKTEVETFCKTGVFKESTEFGTSTFTYVLRAKKTKVDLLEATYIQDTITLYLDDRELSTWAKSDRVGYSSTSVLPSGKQLSLLLEKDFACLDNTTEDQSDNYPNPKNDSNIC
ncbi:hypothetical protein [Flagellimonas sp. MMG031]|uniref:Uncharacterized protein n=1 Tax=Flagellimonas sp. MMG031 TaxID=3158549 RepID=A0AAU7MX42_9FLAO